MVKLRALGVFMVGVEKFERCGYVTVDLGFRMFDFGFFEVKKATHDPPYQGGFLKVVPDEFQILSFEAKMRVRDSSDKPAAQRDL